MPKWLLPVGILGAAAYFFLMKKDEVAAPVAVKTPRVATQTALMSVGVEPQLAASAVEAMTPWEQDLALKDRVFLVQLADEIKGSVEV